MKNRINGFKKAASIMAIAFAAAAGAISGLEWNGYGIFDRTDGNNLLCRADPYCRAMTAGEITLAKTIFGDTIDYSSVKLFNRPYMLIAGRKHGLSPNGNIYINDDARWSMDYAVDVPGQALLIHELAHVWQVQSGRDVRKEAVVEYVRNNFDYNTVYDYDIGSAKKFDRHNLEQQAAMITHYYTLRAAFHVATENRDLTRPRDYGQKFARDMRRDCQKLGQYEEKIMQALPLAPVAGCGFYRPKPDVKPVPAA